MVSIRPVTEVTESLTDAYRALIPQLSSSSNPPTGEALQRIIESDSAQILIAEDENGEILGTMTLIIFKFQPEYVHGLKMSSLTVQLVVKVSGRS